MAKSFLWLSLLAAWLATAIAAASHEQDRMERIRKGSDLLAAKAAYGRFCVACHGENGEGADAAPGSRPRDFGSPAAVAELDRDAMIAVVREGHDDSVRDGWTENLDADSVAALVDYIRETFMLPAPVADASVGRRIYARTCSVCHGERGNAASWAKNSLNPPPRDFTSAKARKMSRRHMIAAVSYGSDKTAMMPFATQLTREEIASTVDYIRRAFMSVDVAGTEHSGGDAHERHARHGHTDSGSGPPDMAAPFPNGLVGDAREGGRFFEKNCAECHGEKGDGKGPRAYFMFKKPANFNSAASRAELNRPHLFKAVSMGVIGTEMSAWSKVLSDQAIANVAEYVFLAFIRGEDTESRNRTGEAPPAPIFERTADKKKLNGETVDAAEWRLGRRVYNSRCYFCHGYDGTARTTAAAVLRPPPRDFTKPPRLTRERIEKTVREGRPGTAMARFEGLLPKDEIAAVATFVENALVRRKIANTRYHTAANGWPDHRRRYGEAFPFVTGALSPEADPERLPAAARVGLEMYRESCATCHLPPTTDPARPPRDAVAESASHEAALDGFMARDSHDIEDGEEEYGAYGEYAEYDYAHGGEALEDTTRDIAASLSNATRDERAGAALYARNCAFCHARDGSGRNWIGRFLEPHPPDFSDPEVAARIARPSLTAVLRDGLAGTSMPAFGKVLDDRDIAALAAFLRRAFPVDGADAH